MLGDITAADELYIVTGYTDMRKSIDGLCAIVEQQLHMDPRCSALYLFLRKAMRSSESPAVGNIRYFELKKPKTGMPKRQMLSICPKEGYSVAELTDIQNELR